MYQSEDNSATGPLALAPAFAVLLGLSSLIFADSIGVPFYAAIFLALLLTSAWILLGTSRITEGFISVFTITLLLVLIFSLISFYRLHKEQIFPPSFKTQKDGAFIVQNREWGKKRALVIDTEKGRFTAYERGDDTPEEGSLVSLSGALFDFKRAKKSGEFDEYLYWRSKGSQKKIILFDMKKTAEPTGMYHFRNNLNHAIKTKLPPNMSGYMLALTTGAKDESLNTLHRSAGTVHLLSVSGFHVGILAFLLVVLFKKGRKKIIAMTFCMWAYIYLAGMPPGGVRAALMTQTALLGIILGKPSYAFNSVSIAGVLLLMHNPFTFFDIGYQLSVSAALLITGFMRFRMYFQGDFTCAAAASFLIWFVTAPIIAMAFDEVPLAGLLVNIFAIPLFSIFFPLF